MKLKRKFVNQKYANLIESMYDQKDQTAAAPTV
jgi:hypothetical protein